MATAVGTDNAGVQVANDTVNIHPIDGANHTVTYDYAGRRVYACAIDCRPDWGRRDDDHPRDTRFLTHDFLCRKTSGRTF
jgi:hypothetical protein